MQSEIKQLYVSLDDKLLEKVAAKPPTVSCCCLCIAQVCVCVSVRCAVCCRKHFHSFNQQSDSRQMMQQLLTSNHIYIYIHKHTISLRLIQSRADTRAVLDSLCCHYLRCATFCSRRRATAPQRSFI